MTLFNQIVLTILWPFEKLISFLFVTSWNLTGNYGISLIIVSFCITAGTAPLYLLADIWKNAEKNIQRRMRADLDSIKRYYSGSKRFYLTKTAYRIYGYKSWHALRTSFRLLIQIPFFFAAYKVLSGYTGYSGVSFLCIKDLATSDKLLFGINILPFLMTAINIVSSFYYTRTASIKENSQLLLMAGVFLVLLYDSPSALLVYWTMNNILSLVKTIIFRHTGIQAVPEPETVLNKHDSFIKKVVSTDRDIVVWFFFMLFCSLEVFWIQTFKESFKYLIAATFIGGVVSSAFCVFFRKKYRWIPLYFLFWAMLIPFYYFFIVNRKYNPYISNVNLKLMITFIQTAILCTGPFLFSLRKNTQTDVPTVSVRQFSLIVFSCAYFLFLYQPLRFYLSSPADFDVLFSSFIGTLIFFVAVCSIAGLCVFMLLPAGVRQRVATFVLYLFMVSILWSFFFRMKTGMLDNFTFQNEDAINNLSFLLYAADPFILAAVLYLARDIVKRKLQTFLPLMIALCLVLTGALGVQLYRTDPETFAEAASAEDSLPETAIDNHRFSSTEKNIVFIILDMFNGNYIGRILDEYPEYANLLEGFTWYPDCLSVSYNTSTSLPAIFGGPEWLPEQLNNNGMTGQEEISLSASNFFYAIQNAGYRTTLANPLYFREADTGNSRKENVYQYVNYWKKINGIDVQGNDSGKTYLSIMLSIFNAVPWHLKPVMYDDGNWIIFRKSVLFTQMKKKAIHDMAYLSFLPHIASTADDTGLFLYIHNELPHSPYGIQKDGSLITNNFPSSGYNNFINPEAAVYSARKSLDLVLDFVAWMKERQIWDNTMVVVLSDHGNGTYDNDIPTDIDGKSLFTQYDLSRAHALLLVKQFDAQGPVKTEWNETSSANIPSLLHELAGIRIPGSDTDFPPEKQDMRMYSSVVGDWEHGLERDSAVFRTYEVTGSLFNRSSWKTK